MSHDRCVSELLEEILESEKSPEDVCGNSPELVAELRMRLEQLRMCDAELDMLFPPVDELHSDQRALSLDEPGVSPEIPGYEIREILGKGGMGVVYRANHLRLNREVALKMLHPAMDSSQAFRDRFIEEAMAVARMRHPNIVQIFDLGEHEGHPYFTMELMEGGNLAQKVNSGLASPSDSSAVVCALAEAVHAAHQCGVIHRDLKPSNILLTSDGIPKISDFGLAKRIDQISGFILSGDAAGTPCYMAPEQARPTPGALSPAVDIYALGAILYELLTGVPPFQGASRSEILRQVTLEDPLPPSQLNGRVSQELNDVCLRCLQKNPQHRYSRADELASELRRLSSHDLQAAKYSLLESKVVRRGLSLGALFVTLLVATLEFSRFRSSHSETVLPAHSIPLQNLSLASVDEKLNDFDAIRARAQDLMLAGKPGDAATYYRSAISLRPDSADCQYDLGRSLVARGDLEGCLDPLRRATELQPTHLPAQQLLLSVLLKLSFLDEAVDRLRGAIDHNPGNARLHTDLGHVLEEKGDCDGALIEYEHATKMDPPDIGSIVAYQSYLARSGKSSVARQGWQEYLEKHPARLSELSTYALFCQFTGDQTEFLRVRESILSLAVSVDDSVLLERAIQCCLLSPVSETELNRISAVLERIRGSENSPSLLGLAHFRKGEFEAATPLLQSYLKRTNDPSGLLLLSMSLFCEGRLEVAQRAMIQASLGHDWRAIRIRNESDWFVHCLRREAERLFIPDVSDVLSGQRLPRDNVERLILLGRAQFESRVSLQASLYAAAFDHDPALQTIIADVHRYNAVRTAIQVGTGHCEVNATLTEQERIRWRKKSLVWLQQELAPLLTSSLEQMATNRPSIWTALTFLNSDPAFQDVRPSTALDGLPPDEQHAWRSLWQQVDELIIRVAHH